LAITLALLIFVRLRKLEIDVVILSQDNELQLTYFKTIKNP